MMTAYLARGYPRVGTTSLRHHSHGTGAAQTEQQRIRAEYLELGLHLHGTAAELGAIELHVAALRMRCTHPNRGGGVLPGYWKPVGPHQCPDCGHVTIGEGESLAAS